MSRLQDLHRKDPLNLNKLLLRAVVLNDVGRAEDLIAQGAMKFRDAWRLRFAPSGSAR